MALTNITFTAAPQANLVVSTQFGLVKVASAGVGTLGTLQAVGVQAGSVVNWSLQGNPGAAIAVSAHQDDATLADITFSNVPPRTEPYLLVITASTPDGKIAQIPLAILVREPFSLQEISHAALAAFTISGHSYDPTVPALTFKGYGPGGVVPGVKFIPPPSLPSGLTFSVDEDDTAYLTPALPTPADPVGGLKTSGQVVLNVSAYKANSLYDTPENPATVTVTYDLTSGPASGVLKFDVGASYDPTEKGVLLDAIVTYKDGQAATHTMDWSVNLGATGTWTTPPNASTLSAIWKPTGAAAQDVTFTINVRNAANAIVATAVVGPMSVSGRAPNDVPGSNWSQTAAVPVKLYPSKLYPQEAGKKVNFRVTLPDLTAAETATVSYTVVAATSNDPATSAVADSPANSTILGSSPTKDAVVSLTVPANSKPYDMWAVKVSVAVTGGGQARSGLGQLLVISEGEETLVVQPASTTLTGNTGSILSPVTLRAYHWAQRALSGTPTDAELNPIPSASNSDLVEVTGVSFQTAGAPAGIAPLYNSGAGLTQLTGLIAKVGTATFPVLATKTGYKTGQSALISLLGQESVTPISFSAFSSTNPTVASNQGFTLTWGYSGAGSGTVTLQKDNNLPPTNVTGTLSSAQTPITASSAYILRGVNTLGEAFSSPLSVLLGATGASTQLPPSTAIAQIDEANHCVLAWQPAPIQAAGLQSPYAAYDYWGVSVKDSPTGMAYDVVKAGVSGADAKKITGLETQFGGTADARRFEFDLPSGYHEMSMQGFAANIPGTLLLNSPAWDTFKAFPAQRTVTLDKDTASKGEAVTITLGSVLGSTGVAGDRWYAIYSDGTQSERFPMNITSVAKAFSTGGQSHTITIVLESDYATAYPPVKLRRTKTLSVFIQDQEYQGAGDAFDIGSATVGLGGELGFEITNNTDGSKAAMPYLVVVPAIVRDDLTNELKLLVATARGRDASSLLGTMAVDVFPLAGRPHTLDLIQVPGKFLATEAGNYDPVKITQDALPDVIVGKNMSPVRLQATGGKKPYRWFATDLPFGISLAVDGTLSGTVMKLGRFPINISVQDAQNPSSIDETTLYLNAKSDLAVKTTSVTNAKVGTAYSFQLEGDKGVKPYTWELMAGALPEGLVINADGTITGWPVTHNSTSDFTTPYPFVTQVTDAVGAKASRQFSMVLGAMPLTILPTNQNVLVQGEKFRLRFHVVGGKPGYTLVGGVQGPAGFVASAQMVNGTVEVVTSEAFSTSATSVNISMRVQDAAGTEVVEDMTLTLKPAIPISRWVAPAFPGFVDTTSNDQTIQIGGQTSGLTFDNLETIPNITACGVVLDAIAASIKVKPPVSAGQNTEVTFRIVAKQGSIILGKVSREISIITRTGTTTNDWTCKALPLAVGGFFAMDPGAPFFNSATPTNVYPGLLRLKEGETLPPGVSIDALSGKLYGTLHSTINPASSTVEIVNAQGDVVSTVPIVWTVVGNNLTISGTLPDVEVGHVYGDPTTGYELTVSGASSSISVDVLHGRLPEGLSLAVTSSTVQVKGRPMEAGYFDLWLRVRDTAGRSGLYQTRLVVNYLPYLQIVTTQIPKIVTGFAYSFSLAATGGKPGYTWALASGSPALPAGMTLDTDGTLHGTTTDSAYTGSPVFQVTDTYGQVVTATLAVVVGAADPLVITTSVLPSGVVGAPYIGVQLQAIGGVPPYNWPQVVLPAGLSLNSTTGVISGTPTAQNSGNITFSVTDALGTTTQKALQLQILAANAFRISTDTLPDGKVGVAYGSTTTTTPTFSLAATMPEPRVGHTSNVMTLNGKSYLLILGGNNSGRLASQQSGQVTVGNGIPGASYGNSSALPLLFDPDAVVNGNRVGQFSLGSQAIIAGDAGANALSPVNLLDRAFAASAQVAADEIVIIGGCRLGGNPTDPNRIFAYTDRTIKPGTHTDGKKIAPVLFVKLSGTSLTITAGPTLSTTVGASTAQGRHGAAATTLKDGRVFVCGGVAITEATQQVSGPGGSGSVTTGDYYNNTGPLTYTNESNALVSWMDYSAQGWVGGDGNLYHYKASATLGSPEGQPSPVWYRRGWHVAYTTYYLTAGEAATINNVQTTQTNGGDVQVTTAYTSKVETGCSGKEAFILTLSPTRGNSTWTRVADMPVALVLHKAVTLPDGRVLVLGGLTGTLGAYADQNGSTTCLIYNPTTNTWATGPAMPTKEFAHDAVVLSDGRVLYGGKNDQDNATSYIEPVYVLDAGLTAWTSFANHLNNAPNGWGSMDVLPDGTVVWVGGTDNACWSDPGLLTGGLNVFTPDLTLYSSQADLNAANYSGLYPWAASTGKFDAYFLNTNTSVSTHLDAVGGIPPYGGFTAVDALPTGMTLNPTTGVLSGTPSAAFDALVRFTATDSTAPGAGGPLVTPQKPIHILITDPDAPVWVTPSLPTANVEENYSFQLVAKDGLGAVLVGNYTPSPNSAFGLPAGLSLSNSGVISGKPTQLGSRQITFRVTNPANPAKYADKVFTLVVQCNTQLTTTTLPVATPGVTYTGQLSVSGGKAPYSFSIASGTLPSGLTLNTTTGAITGTPGSSPDKDVAMVFNVSDPNGCTASASVTLSVRNVAMAISPSSLAATQGLSFSQLMSCTGGSGTYTWNIQGLPSEFNYNSTTGQITASSVTSPIGTYPLTVKATDSTGANTTAAVNLVVSAPNYLWRSGPQVAGVAWTGASYLSPNPIPIARMWQRFLTNGGNAGNYMPAQGFMVGDPFHVVIDGAIQSASPTLTLGNGGGVAWVSELISATGSRAVFRVHPNYSDPNYPKLWLSGLTDFTIAATLNDGGSLSSATLKVFVEPTNGSLMPAAEAVMDAAGVAPLTTYSDYQSRQSGLGGA